MTGTGTGLEEIGSRKARGSGKKARKVFSETQAADQGVLEKNSASVEESKSLIETWRTIFRYITAVETLGLPPTQ